MHLTYVKFKEELFMLKRKMLGVSVAALSFVAIVGSGFSAWVFQSEVRADLTINDIQIIHATSFGTMEGDNNTYRLQLDQGDKTVATDGVKLLAKATGTDTYSDATNVSATWNISDASFGDLDLSKLHRYFNVYIKKSTLGKYVTTTLTVKESETDTTDHKHNASSEYYLYQAEITLPANATKAQATALSYNVDGIFQYYNTASTDKLLKPATMQEYQEMVNTLKATGVTAASDVVADTDYTVPGTNNDIILEFQVVYNN